MSLAQAFRNWEFDELPFIWKQGVAGFGFDDIALGLTKCIRMNPSFAPSLGEFLESVELGTHDPSESYAKFLKNKWDSLPERFVLSRHVFEIKQLPQRQSFEAYKKFLARGCKLERMGELWFANENALLSAKSVVSEADKACTNNIGKKHKFSRRIQKLMNTRKMTNA
ncbi:TPA: hypothetical protein P0E12_004969 [Vibrio harveyi]|nr:hypothetical protein [Vibrio harveyi]